VELQFLLAASIMNGWLHRLGQWGFRDMEIGSSPRSPRETHHVWALSNRGLNNPAFQPRIVSIPTDKCHTNPTEIRIQTLL
jgi:hypothetical protein